MEFKPMHRLLSIMLCFTMLSALTIVGMVSAESEELIARKMISWKGQELADEAQKTGLTNRHGEAIFTTYQDQIGLQAPKGSNDYMIHSWSLPHQQGETPLYQQGDLLSMVLRVWNPDDDLEEGDFITPELCYDWSGVNAIFGETMTAEDYSNATTYIDENYGYEYKEWSVMAVLDSDVYDQMDLLFQIRVRSHGNGTLNLYGLSVYNDTTETMLVDANGSQFGGQSNLPLSPLTQGEAATGIVSYCGEPYPGRGEPYSKYNADGIQGCAGDPDQPADIISDPEGALLLSGFGNQLSAGQYAAQFTFFTQYSLGVEKAVFSVMCGEETIATLPYTVFSVIERLGDGTPDLHGLYDTISLDFTVDEEHAGKSFSLKVVVVNKTDFYLRDIGLYKILPADALPDAQSQAVMDMIDALSYGSSPEKIVYARESVDALSLDQRIWIEDAMLSKLERLTHFIDDCDQVIAAIDAIDAVTEEHYADCLVPIQSAEQALQNLIAAYGEDAVSAVVNREKLAAAREEYDRLMAQAMEREKEAAIHAVEERITAIGEVNEKNYNEKKELIEAAEAALEMLQTDYDEATAALVGNKSDLETARAKYDEYSRVIFGDINIDQKIDAQDALLALQHSVGLTTLDAVQFIAADVNDDQKVDASDALLMLQHSVNLIKQFPIEQQ